MIRARKLSKRLATSVLDGLVLAWCIGALLAAIATATPFLRSSPGRALSTWSANRTAAAPAAAATGLLVGGFTLAGSWAPEDVTGSIWAKIAREKLGG